MHCLIRRITRKSKTGVSHSDSVVDADSISIGRATDQDVFLPDLHVALRHAVLSSLSSGRFAVKAKTPSGVQINGRTVQAGTVDKGDVLRVGRTELRLLKPPAGADLALEIDEGRIQEGRQLEVGALSLQQTWLRKRPWAWLLFLLVLGFGLGVPFASIHEVAAPSWLAGGDDPLADPEPVPWHALGGDRIWDSGPMSREHRFFGHDCGSCHTAPFQRVADAACLQCHEGTPHHTDDAAMLQTAGLTEERCADCHLEHNGSEGLIATKTSLCTDCHSEPGRNMPSSQTLAVTGFSPDSHPRFRIRLVAAAGDGTFSWRRLRMTGGAMSEDNGLVFPHEPHLAADGIEGPEGMETLACGDCHRTGPKDIAMQPTRFERDCQRCHRLDFEPNEPSRQLPHGQPDMVVAMLEEYYARVALAGGYRNPQADPPATVQRRRPGAQELAEAERRVALQWAQDWAAEVATEVFEYRTCKTCHAIERHESAPGGWHVQPVALTQNWFPAHEFTHDPHLGMACTDCHDAERSEASSDVLMPGIDTCLECHGDDDGGGQVFTRCVDCHGFHAADELVMQSPGGRSTAGVD